MECRVVACAGRGRTRIETRGLPDPGTGELLLRIRVAGLCGTDIVKLANDAVPPGTVLGHEVVGEVIAAGAGVEGFAAGDRVVVPHHVACGRCPLCARGSETMCVEFRRHLLEPGGFAGAVLVRPRAVAVAARRLPGGLADEIAVFMEPAACVLRGLRRSGIAPDGDGAVAVLGGGSMGLLHLLVFRALYPGWRVLVVEPVEERRALARALGAAAAAPPGGDEALEAIHGLSGGLGADAVFDTAGGAGALGASLALARTGGTAVLFAHAPDGARADFDLNELFKREKRVVGTYSGTAADQAAVFAAMTAGALDPRPLVTHKLPLEYFDDAVRLTRERRALKVLLVPE
jgi:L-iditol 2-dehydrogenase